MRNLYHYLGIRSDSSIEYIRSAIRRSRDPKIEQAAKEILTDTVRKSEYDRLNTTLIEIGKIRSLLDLEDTDNWRLVDRSSYRPYWHSSPNPARRSQPNKRKEKKGESPYRWLAVSIALLVLVGIIAIPIYDLYGAKSDQLPSSAPANTALDRPTEKTPLQSESQIGSRTDSNLFDDLIPLEDKEPDPALPLPNTGTIFSRVHGDSVAPLRIVTQGGQNYFIKLEELARNDSALTIFIRGGDSFELDVPLGSYSLKYATGREWYGESSRFGSNESTFKADETFVFRRTRNQITGFTVHLYSVADGNLETRPIASSQF